VVAHIGEVDARKLYAHEAMPSMFAYCVERLRLGENEAYLRIAAARASRGYPLLFVMLRDGRIHLTAVARLASHLTPPNHRALLERAVNRSKREIEDLIAELAPRAASRSSSPPTRGCGTGWSDSRASCAARCRTGIWGRSSSRP
jgi:hypothetical protein